MSYQALLFCPDEKTARVVSQVLTELEFTVEPCHEPFAAVKKLMVQHFDAIVVDCDNEQNAALLFKSARNSGSNQASLAVAVVEGQTGVAKAFRLGANLVLTKPIHVEQSKGTLRVARGLLRKGQAAKAAAGPSVVSATSNSATATAAPQQFVSAPIPSRQAIPAASASAFELDAEPAPQPDVVDAALLEYMPDSPQAAAEADADSSKQYPWQPRKPLAEPMASALRRAAEAAGKSEFDAAAAARPVGASHSGNLQAGMPQTNIPQTSVAHAGMTQAKSGAAAAPARAREIPALGVKNLGLEPTASAIAAPSTEIEEPAEVKRIVDPSAKEGWESNSESAIVDAPTFSSLDGGQHASDAGGSKKTVLIAVLVIGLAAAGYFGWTKMQSTHPQPEVQQSAAPASSGIAALPPQPTPSATGTEPVAGEVATQQQEPGLTGGAAVSVPSNSVSSKPSAAVMAEVPGNKAPAPAKVISAEEEVESRKLPATVKTESSAALVVQNGSAPQVKTQPEAQTEEAPEATSIATGSGNSAVSGIVNTNAMNAQKAPQQTLRISQGVSEGMIVKRVQPTYPPQARQMRVEGRVELQANISPTGSITGLKQLSGDMVLGRAAIDAVRQWKYKPYFLNGQPIEIQTQITVNFKLP